MSSLVSIVIPTYNHGNHIALTLESVFAQSFTDIEVIVVNDGSPDDTAAVLRPYVDVGRIRYVEQANAGQASARNAGIALARGRYIAFLDDDDLWPADKLRWQVESLSRSDAVLAGGWVRTFTANLGETHEWGVKPGRLRRCDLADGCPFFSPGQTLIRRSAIEDVGGFDSRVWGADDYDLYIRLAKVGELHVDRRISLHYRVHAHNASKQRARMLQNAMRVVDRHFPDEGSDDRRRAYRWLYGYVGHERLTAAWCSAQQCRFGEAARDLRLLLPFLRAVRGDHELARQMIADLRRRPSTEASAIGSPSSAEVVHG